MDLVDFDEQAFEKVHKDFEDFSAKLAIKDVRFVPISALMGDNVVDRSENMKWYQGPTLLHILENVHIGSDQNHIDPRFPVQYVVRPMTTEYHDYRGYAGRVAGGVFRQGEEISVLPSGFTSKIKSIDTMTGPIKEAFPPMSVTMTLEDDIDISRGDMIVKVNNQPEPKQEFDVMICWLNEKPMQVGGKYALKHTSRDARCIIKDVKYKMNINTLQKLEDDNAIGLNDIGRITLRTTVPIFQDGYRKNRNTGSLILVDEATNNTVGACMVV
jgi:sulfate adenylyltransferase subunit 1